MNFFSRVLDSLVLRCTITQTVQEIGQCTNHVVSDSELTDYGQVNMNATYNLLILMPVSY